MGLIPTKYFCPQCLVEMQPDLEWNDCPEFRCPKCGSHGEDFEMIEATALTKKEIKEKRKQFLSSVKWLWDNPEGHFYIPFHYDVIHPLQYSRGPWLTCEMAEEDDEEYICAYLTTKVDTLGYTYGDILADGYIRKEDSDKDINDYFDFLIGGLDEYGCLDGKLISAPRELQRGRLKGEPIC